ncbi:solute carrier family 35 (UDP-xylose/UDP-N-acetylglucosamine transporter), member B4 [Sporothrix brasiliensis 5110]|uniref:Solute carrier family 35 (UDP-xylose/UDP-N-acetylglucosamine transporter), member B4 n=1 Tax=Sporothrix brasiliensis 5110 TaxID=1398154 RepID=A0A0C2F888_9PEZI|nr:solute carrier family 35 (UDP-xylose/UDP-N-acetylglucosamine transporter), member B4 [Sporothrix brasiliensis 5110]KIH95269.1 solute carrier family 35 (UDP-xylose/UDP-N-acetylglucosamine transporter), member B4 [Sporothrix brasiliensis 5110]
MTTSNARRRQTSHKPPKHVATTPGPRVINAAPSLEKAEMYGVDDDRPVFSRAMALAGRIFIETIPQWLTIGAMLALIFGGCCSNVFALEAIIKVEPASGTLLTFTQFLFVAITGYVSQFDGDRPPFFIQPNKVPIKRWCVNIVLFFSINVLNNHAFSYNISVPVHIILRSGGSITTMIAGFLYGKRYSRIQILAVILLTVGVVVAAWSDAQSKGVAEEAAEGNIEFIIGLSILFVAQVLSSIMGLYTEETYKKYGPQWRENLFYSHLLSLPLFLPFLPSLVRQFSRLANSAPLSLPFLDAAASTAAHAAKRAVDGADVAVAAGLRESVERIHIPSQLVYLVLNVLTQYACIRGVNLLAAASSALTVTIVLNIRKLVSLLFSIWLFGNRLSPGTLIGAIIVFSAGGLYSFDGKRKPSARPRAVSVKVG